MANAQREASVFWPNPKDPRIPFACILSLYAVLGCTTLGFNRNPVQILLTVAAAGLLELGLHRALKGTWILPLSAYISGVSLSLLLNYSHNYYLLFFPVFFTIASKYLFTFQGRHVFNPSLFGVVIALKLGGGLFASAPAYQWGGSPAMAAFIVTLALTFFVFRIGRLPLIISFLGFYAIQLGVRAWVMRWHLPVETIVMGTLSSAPFYLFTFFMLTDPKTSPAKPWAQVAWSFGVVVLDLWFHTRETLSTLFFALFTLSALNWIWLHGRAAWQSRFRLRIQWKIALLNWSVISALAGAGYTVYHWVIHPQSAHAQPGFSFQVIESKASGVHSELGNALNEVHPRIRHFAKWLVSVGDAVATGDFDNDGLLDLFLTNPLKRPEDRNALYRNCGNFRFERVEIPCLREVSFHPEKHGLMAGAYFVDYDNSGAQSLLLCGAYGKTRLLKNLIAETGRPEFIDVSDRVGLTDHTISVAATFFDYDRDGNLDLLVANSLTPLLPGYDRPMALNIFRLPEPQFAGDRRMFRFMHESWHNATNGGANHLFRNDGAGKYRKADMGMVETHISLACGTADLNDDGYTDLYVANDFGPDDLYLNEEGKRFVRIAGTFFGSVGRDTYKGMNVSIGDLRRRGRQDIYVSNVHVPLQAEGSLLWMNYSNPKNSFVPRFSDEATVRGTLNEGGFGWGAAMGDLNHDGWLDIIQANGMVDDTPDKRFPQPRQYWYAAEKVMRSGPDIHAYVDRWPDLRGYEIFGRQSDRVYLSRGDKKVMQFVDVASQVGLTRQGNSRGIALADFDNDGALDLAITHQFAPLSLYRNVASARHHWLGVSLSGDGRRVSREAIGTQVFVSHGKIRQMREVQVANGFSAQGDRRLLFGLGEHTGPVSVEVRWYGARTNRFENLALDRYHKVVYSEERLDLTRN